MFLLPRDLQELFEILLLNYKELLRKGILNSPTSTNSAVPPLTPPPPIAPSPIRAYDLNIIARTLKLVIKFLLTIMLIYSRLGNNCLETSLLLFHRVAKLREVRGDHKMVAFELQDAEILLLHCPYCTWSSRLSTAWLCWQEFGAVS